MKSGLQPCMGCGFQLGWPDLARSVGVPLLLDAAREHRRVVGLANYDLCFRPLFGKHTGNAFQRAAGTESRDPVIEALTREVIQNFLRCGAGVHVGVGFVFKLARVDTIRASRPVPRSC